jgi:interferon gamma-inducible protein 30
MFVTEQIPTVAAEKELADLVDFKLIPYGNAMTFPGDVVKCQHGPKECTGNMIENCAIDQMSYSNSLQFIYCMETALMNQTEGKEDPEAASHSCFAKQSWGVSEDELKTCYTGPQGALLVKAAAAETDKDHDYVPWVDLNGAHSKGAEMNLKATVCGALGASAPKTCSSIGPDVEPKRSYAEPTPEILV